MRSWNHGRTSVLAAATAALFSLVLWGSAPSVGAQSVSVDPSGSSNSPLVIPNSPEVTHRVFLPLAAKPSDPPPPPVIFGVQIYSDLSSPGAALPLATQAHVSWVRWHVLWAAIEPSNTTPANYNYYTDSAVLAAQKAGLRLIITIDSAPPWAATIANGRIDKTDISEFAQFMGALVERYDGDGRQDAPGSPVVDYWEFYNEPDGGYASSAQSGAAYWGPFGAEYAQMLCAVYPVMKAASPRAQIALGGIAHDWFTDEGGPFVRRFLDDVLDAGGGNCLDAMNFHYYPAFHLTWDPYGSGLAGKANYLRSKLAPHGLANLPMIVTEAGWHSNDYSQFPSTPEIQAGYVVKLFVQSLASDVRVMMWWTWSDKEISGFWGANGLLDLNLQKKLAYHAYQTAASQLGNAAFQRILSPGVVHDDGSIQAYLFLRGNPLYVLWSTEPHPESVSLPGSSARVTDYVGNLVAQVADGDDGQSDGRVRVTVGADPRYVETVP